MAINSRIHILKYNTYFDRIFKREETISAYDQYLLYDKTNNPGIFNVDFKPTDGVSTSQIINWNGDEPNYLVVTDISNTETVISRWFVMECTRIRSGQYQLSLRRDVIADNIDDISNSTAFINKAIVSDDSPLIYNQEEITTNQIKTKEIPLKDDTGSAWIIGYIPSDQYNENTDFTFAGASIFPDYTKESWPYSNYIGIPVHGTYTYDFDFQVKDIIYPNSNIPHNIYNYIYRNFTRNNSLSFPTNQLKNYKVSDTGGFNRWVGEKKTEINQALSNYVNLYSTVAPSAETIFNGILKDQGKIILDNGKYYRIDITTYIDEILTYITTNKSGEYLYTYLSDLFLSCPYRDKSITDAPGFRINFKYKTLKITLTEINTSEYKCTIPGKNTREHLKDAPYDMFAIPYSDDLVMKLSGTTNYEININKTSSLQIAQGLAKSITKQVLLDLQLLPYCPFSGYSMTDNELIMPYKEGRTALVKNSADAVVSCIVFCTASSGTKNIVLNEPLTWENKKIENQCNFYRLVSPNYNGQFEFNLAKNNINGLNLFNVDFTYLPYNPYIHINPQFGGLYGEDYNDARGLICQGDFSVAYMTDRWAEYQIQNKNYQNIFNRETQKLEYDHKLDLGAGITKAVLGAAQGAASGMAIGSVGGPIGAAVGGIIGGASSLLGGAADIGIGEAKFGEAMKYRKDIFNMQLDNIRALPNSIAKSTAFTYNNKIFPILEFYTCTDSEKQVVANLIANSSMKVGNIDNVSSYLANTWSYGDIKSRGFLSCQIIKLGNLSVDAHMQYTIFDEMEKGIYFGG